LEGNESLGDLPATVQDADNAEKMALRLGVKMENVKRLTKTSVDDFKKFTKAAVGRFAANSAKNGGKGKTFLFVYMAGHGVSD
jgi:hypothetical protein